MNAHVKDYLHDILDSISKNLFSYTKTTSLIELINNLTITDAVDRRLAIIGEAIRKATKIDTSIKISGYKKIISLIHILIYKYDLIDNGTLWKIIENDLPVLNLEIKQLLKDSEK